jgi:L-methionine (R)-S-oxide reductase
MRRSVAGTSRHKGEYCCNCPRLNKKARLIFSHLYSPEKNSMAETIVIPDSIQDKKEKYEVLIPQLKALMDGEPDTIANLSNIMAALKYGMNFFWIGIYFVKDNELVLGPFQGHVACVRIAKGKGVCGVCWEKEESIIVKNVDEFPGHIACSADSKSEIVIPVFKNGKVSAVLDADSDKLAFFDETDEVYLKKIADLIGSL